MLLRIIPSIFLALTSIYTHAFDCNTFYHLLIPDSAIRFANILSRFSNSESPISQNIHDRLWAQIQNLNNEGNREKLSPFSILSPYEIFKTDTGTYGRAYTYPGAYTVSGLVGRRDNQLTLFLTGINLDPGSKNYSEKSQTSGKKLAQIMIGAMRALDTFAGNPANKITSVKIMVGPVVNTELASLVEKVGFRKRGFTDFLEALSFFKILRQNALDKGDLFINPEEIIKGKVEAVKDVAFKPYYVLTLEVFDPVDKLSSER